MHPNISEDRLIEEIMHSGGMSQEYEVVQLLQGFPKWHTQLATAAKFWKSTNFEDSEIFANPSIPQEVLFAFALSKKTKILGKIGRNPNANAATMRLLFESGDPAGIMGALEHSSTPPEILESVIADHTQPVPNVLCRNKSLTFEMIQAILNRQERELADNMQELFNLPTFTQELFDYALDAIDPEKPDSDLIMRVILESKFVKNSKQKVEELMNLMPKGAHSYLDTFHPPKTLEELADSVMTGDISQSHQAVTHPDTPKSLIVAFYERWGDAIIKDSIQEMQMRYYIDTLLDMPYMPQYVFNGLMEHNVRPLADNFHWGEKPQPIAWIISLIPYFSIYTIFDLVNSPHTPETILDLLLAQDACKFQYSDHIRTRVELRKKYLASVESQQLTQDKKHLSNSAHAAINIRKGYSI